MLFCPLVDRPLFQFFDCWDHSIYLLIFLSILAIGCVYGLIHRSFSAIFEAIWDYSSVILSDYLTLKPKSIKTRILATIWLLVNTILLCLYSGALYDFIIRGQIVDRIEMKEELISKENWLHSNIYLIDPAILKYVFWSVRHEDSLVEHLVQKYKLNDLYQIYFNNSQQKAMFEDVFRNNALILANKLNLYLYLRKVQSDWPIIMGNYIEGLDYYIS